MTLQPGNGLKPYYLLWGYRKCGTTSLAHSLRQSGVAMPDWDESNIWMAQPDCLPDLFDRLWQGMLDAPYLVDLSTLTHLGRGDPGEVLAARGFAPVHIVCTRPPGPRWVSAYTHMARKKSDMRSLRSYIDFYDSFLGLSRADLRQLEDDLIRRDLTRGTKSQSGVFTRDYFQRSYPLGFEADPIDPLYQFRYFGETIDMLEKRPAAFTVLPLGDPKTSASWINRNFGVDAPYVDGSPMNRKSLFNKLRHHPNLSRISRHAPRPIRHGLARWIETTSLLPKIGSRPRDLALEKEMAQLAEDLISPVTTENLEPAHA